MANASAERLKGVGLELNYRVGKNRLTLEGTNPATGTGKRIRQQSFYLLAACTFWVRVSYGWGPAALHE